MAEPQVPGAEALQAAALQLISAARTFLDAAEQVVRDPDAVRQVASTASALAKGIVDAVAPRAPSPPPPSEPLERIDLGGTSAS
jgi:hypothetical protein